MKIWSDWDGANNILTLFLQKDAATIPSHCAFFIEKLEYQEDIFPLLIPAIESLIVHQFEEEPEKEELKRNLIAHQEQIKFIEKQLASME